MRIRLVVLAVAILLLRPGVATADLIALETGGDGAGSFPELFFGTDPVIGHFDVLNVFANGSLVFLPGLGSGITGRAEFSTGPLLSLDVDTIENRAQYTYASGVFTFNADWTSPLGAAMTGSFVAPLLNFAIETCEGDCFQGLATAEFRAALGAGTFDQNLARVLGVSPTSLGGTFQGALDLIDGDTSSAQRFGGEASPWDITINATIPEPSLTGLAAVIAASFWARRRMNRVGRYRTPSAR